MALQKELQTVFGITIPNAYFRVDNVVINNKTNMSFLLKAYADTSSKEVDVQNMVCTYDLNGDNPIKQAYEHLKTLPEFAGAADV